MAEERCRRLHREVPFDPLKVAAGKLIMGEHGTRMFGCLGKHKLLLRSDLIVAVVIVEHLRTVAEERQAAP